MTDTERALPITAEWLLEIGFLPLWYDRMHELNGIKCKTTWTGAWLWWIGNSPYGEIYQQRGEVLDLLAALKIKPKGAPPPKQTKSIHILDE